MHGCAGCWPKRRPLPSDAGHRRPCPLPWSSAGRRPGYQPHLAECPAAHRAGSSSARIARSDGSASPPHGPGRRGGCAPLAAAIACSRKHRACADAQLWRSATKPWTPVTQYHCRRWQGRRPHTPDFQPALDAYNGQPRSFHRRARAPGSHRGAHQPLPGQSQRTPLEVKVGVGVEVKVKVKVSQGDHARAERPAGRGFRCRSLLLPFGYVLLAGIFLPAVDEAPYGASRAFRRSGGPREQPGQPPADDEQAEHRPTARPLHAAHRGADVTPRRRAPVRPGRQRGPHHGRGPVSMAV